MSFSSTRQTMIQYFIDNPNLRKIYVDNIAMLLHDKWGITGFEERNQAAKDIMTLIFPLKPVTL